MVWCLLLTPYHGRLEALLSAYDMFIKNRFLFILKIILKVLTLIYEKTARRKVKLLFCIAKIGNNTANLINCDVIKYLRQVCKLNLKQNGFFFVKYTRKKTTFYA